MSGQGLGVERSERELNTQLIERGWRQYSLVSVDGIPEGVLQGGAGDNPAPPWVLVVSHDCDISSVHEPNFEVFHCFTAQDLRQYKKGHPRFFVVDRSEKLVACAFQRSIITKRLLDDWTPSNVRPLNDNVRHRLRRWHLRRVDRPAFSDEQHEFLVRPILNHISRWRKDNPDLFALSNGAISQIRYIQNDETREVNLLVLTESDVSAMDDPTSEAIHAFCDELRNLPLQQGFTVDSVIPVYEELLQLGALWRSDELSEEWLSYEGDEPIGALPPTL